MVNPSSSITGTTSSVVERRSGSLNNLLAFLLMVTLITVLFLFAAGFTFVDKVQSVVVLSFRSLKRLFTFETSSIVDESSSSSFYPMVFPSSSKIENDIKPLSSDLEAGLLHEMNESLLKKEEEIYKEEPVPLQKEQPQEEIPVIKPKRRTLDMAIETLSTYSDAKGKDVPYEPIPIEEHDISYDVKGWCFIGQSKGARSCAPVGEMDKCVTGEMYANQMECLQMDEDASKPLALDDEESSVQESDSESESETDE